MVKKILLISLAGIGDLIMTTPAIKAMRKAYPNSKIEFLTFPLGGEEVVKGSGLVDKIYIYTDPKHTTTHKSPNIIKLISSLFLLFKLRMKRFDLSISFLPSASDKHGLIAKAINAKQRIGFKSKHYTNKLPQDMKTHKVDQNISLLGLLGIKVKNKKQIFHIGKISEEFAENFWLKNNPKNKMIIGIHPGNWWRTNFRRWPMKNFAEFSDRLIEKYNAKILVVCGPSEEDAENKILNLVKNKEELIIVKKQSLKNIAGIMKKCRVLIGNDSGIIHLGEAIGIPIIDIAGYTQFKYSGPYEKENKKNIAWKKVECYDTCVLLKSNVLEKLKKDETSCDYRCFTTIKVKYLLEKVSKIIN